jgi:hypothetical protein
VEEKKERETHEHKIRFRERGTDDEYRTGDGGRRQLWYVWFVREIVKREIGKKREQEKRERDEKCSRFVGLFGIRGV